MDLIDRYVAAVRILLPRAQRDDIVAELRDVLTGCREEQAAELGRPLTQQEEEALLREFGHPVLVAGRYKPQQYLVGPEFYPVYAFVLKLVLVVVAAAALLTGVVSAVASSEAASSAAAKALEIAWNGAFGAVGAVTVIFAILQRYFPRLLLLGDWRARDLPALRKARRATWFDHIAGIVVNALFLLWWTQRIDLSGFLVLGPDQLHLGFAPVWAALYWPMIGIAVVAIAVHSLSLRDGTRRLGRMLDLTLQLGILATAIMALRAGHWVVASNSSIPERAVEQIDQGVNLGFEVGLIVVACIALLRAGFDLWQLSAGRTSA